MWTGLVASLALALPGTRALPQEGPRPPRGEIEPLTPEIREGMRAARELFEANRFPESAKACEELVRAHPGSIEAWLALAGVHLCPDWASRRDARAESASRRALQLGGRRPDILQALATALFREAKYEQCAPILDELIDATPPKLPPPELADMHVLRAHLALREEALDAAAKAHALEDLRAALILDANHPLAHLLLAETLVADGKPEEALGHLQAALVVTPGDKSVHYQLYVCLAKLKRRDEAKHHYDIWHLINRLTDSRSQTNAPDPKERREILAKLKLLSPGDLGHRLDLVDAEIELGEFDAAGAEIDELLKQKPGWTAALQRQVEVERAKASGR
jgi:tetratricopeptide (TPR) repeat protein